MCVIWGFLTSGFLIFLIDIHCTYVQFTLFNIHTSTYIYVTIHRVQNTLSVEQNIQASNEASSLP